MRYSLPLAAEYERLYASLEIRLDRVRAVDELVDRVLEEQYRYTQVSDETGIPWFLIAALHNLESDLDFGRHLHNGDPLSARTIHIPQGRPPDGDPPFEWEESAIDALTLQRLDTVADWTLPRLLYEIEAYNGWGYRLNHPEVLTPYLWSFSQHYHSGKFIADGRWSDTAKSRQCGAAVLIRRLEQLGLIASLTGTAPRKPVLYYSRRPQARAAELQRFLNGFDGIALLVDGIPGPKTSDAFRQVFGHYLHRDPRASA